MFSKFKSFINKHKDVINSPVCKTNIQATEQAYKIAAGAYGLIQLQLSMAGVTNIENEKQCNANEVIAYSLGCFQCIAENATPLLSEDEYFKASIILCAWLLGSKELGELYVISVNVLMKDYISSEDATTRALTSYIYESHKKGWQSTKNSLESKNAKDAFELSEMIFNYQGS